MIVQQRPWTEARPGITVLVSMKLFRVGGEPWDQDNMGRITSLLEVKPRWVSFFHLLLAFLSSNYMYLVLANLKFCYYANFPLIYIPNISTLKETRSQLAVGR